MNPLNPFAVSGLWIVITYLPLTTLLFIKGKNHLSFIFGLHMTSVLIWGLGSFFVALTPDPKDALKIWWFAESGVIFIPIFFYHAILIMIKERSRIILPIIYTQAIFFLIALHTGNLISTTHYMFNSIHYKVATPLFCLFAAIWLAIVVMAHIKLYAYYIKCGEFERKFLNAQLVSIASFVCGGSSFIPAFGINLYPFGNFIVPIHSFCVCYAIFKHQLFNIKIAIRKSLIYSALILLVALLYFSVIFLSERFTQGILGYKSIGFSVTIAFIIGIVFFPLHNYIQRLVDRFIFQKTTEEISKENELLRAEVFKSEKLKSVAVLASGMAHEIKNPLTALKTFSEYLPSKLDDKEFLLKFSKIVGGEVNRIDELVNELLEFAKPSPIQLKETNPNKLITDTLDFLNSKFLQQKITVKTDLSPNCNELIMLDQNKIRQALLNLFLNAIEAMKPDGVLTIVTSILSSPNASTPLSSPNTSTPLSSPNAFVRDPALLSPPKSSVGGPQQKNGFPPKDRGNDSNVFIAITDTGCGIEADKLVTIFDPFYSTKDAGTGLGLPITHGIIKNHGGEIKVTSTVGKGTTFTLIIPRTPQNT